MKAILHGQSPKTKELRFVHQFISFQDQRQFQLFFCKQPCFAKFRFSRFSNQIGHPFLFYFQGSAQLIFVLFVIFLSIILMNLLLAFTVSETDKLQDAGYLIRLEKTVSQITSIEDTLVHKPTILQCFPTGVAKRVYQNTSVFKGLKKRIGRNNVESSFRLCVRPFTPIEKPIGKYKSWAYSNIKKVLNIS